jgi:hypothetical protein
MFSGAPTAATGAESQHPPPHRRWHRNTLRFQLQVHHDGDGLHRTFVLGALDLAHVVPFTLYPASHRFKVLVPHQLALDYSSRTPPCNPLPHSLKISIRRILFLSLALQRLAGLQGSFDPHLHSGVPPVTKCSESSLHQLLQTLVSGVPPVSKRCNPGHVCLAPVWAHNPVTIQVLPVPPRERRGRRRPQEV